MTIHLAYAADANYGPYLGISIASVLNCNAQRALHFHILSDGIRRRDLNRIRRMVAQSSKKFSLYSIDKKLDSFRPVNREPTTLKYATRTSYARLWLDQILPRTVDHLLYLDCDTVCLGDLAQLWNTRHDIRSVAAIRDNFCNAKSEYKTQALRMPNHAPYYNAGVMLINLARWRYQQFSLSFQQFLSSMREPPKTLDQDVINAVLWKEIQPLDPRWHTCCWPDADISAGRILHFACKFKPWQHGYSGPRRKGISCRKAHVAVALHAPDYGIRRTLRRLKRSIEKRLSA